MSSNEDLNLKFLNNWNDLSDYFKKSDLGTFNNKLH